MPLNGRLEPREVQEIPVLMQEGREFPLVIHYCPSCEDQAKLAENDPLMSEPRGPYFVDAIFDYNDECEHEADDEHCGCRFGDTLSLTYIPTVLQADFKTEEEAITGLIKIVEELSMLDRKFKKEIRLANRS